MLEGSYRVSCGVTMVILSGVLLCETATWLCNRSASTNALKMIKFATLSTLFAFRGAKTFVRKRSTTIATSRRSVESVNFVKGARRAVWRCRFDVFSLESALFVSAAF